MPKKIVAALALLTSPAFANPLVLNNLYLGSSVGIDTVSFNQHARVINRDSNVIDDQNYAGRGSFLSLFAGYKWQCQRFYLAGEINLNQSTLQHNSTNTELVHHTISNTSYKINNSYGLSILPGFIFSDCTLFFGRLGWNRGHFEVTTTDSSLANVSEVLNGFRYGLGMQQNIYPHIAVRLEYNRIQYQNKSFFVIAGTTTKATTISPTTNQFELGFVFSWC